MRIGALGGEIGTPKIERTAMTTRVLVAVWMYWILAPCTMCV